MVINLEIKDHLKKYAWDLVNKHDFGSGLKRAGKKMMQFRGILGECVICDVMDYPLTTGEKPDGGIDFINRWNVTWDIKTVGRSSLIQPHYHLNYYADQFNHAADYFLFGSMYKLELLQVCGYIPSRDLLKAGKHYAPFEKSPKDDGTNYVCPFETIQIIQKDLIQFKRRLYEIEEIKKGNNYELQQIQCQENNHGRLYV